MWVVEENGMPMSPAEIQRRIRRSQWLAWINLVLVGLNAGDATALVIYRRSPLVPLIAGSMGIAAAFFCFINEG